MDLLRTLEDNTVHLSKERQFVEVKKEISQAEFTEHDLSNACHAELDESIVALQQNPNIETVFIEDEFDKPEYIEDVQSLVDSVSLENSLKNPHNSDITSNKEILEKRILKPPDGSFVKIINFNSCNGESNTLRSSKLQIHPPKHIVTNNLASQNNLLLLLTPSKGYATIAQEKGKNIGAFQKLSPKGNLMIENLVHNKLFRNIVSKTDVQIDKPKPTKAALTVKCPTISQFEGHDQNKKYMYVPKYVTTLDSLGKQIELELVNRNNQLSYVPKPKSGSISASLPIDSVKLQVENCKPNENDEGGENSNSMLKSTAEAVRDLTHPKDAIILISDSEDDELGSAQSTRSLIYTNCSILRDKHFKCWGFPARKRNLSGFSMTDPLGFLQSEKQRCRKCVRNVKNACMIISRSILFLQNQLESREGNIFGNVKFVEVEEIKSRDRKKLALKKQSDSPKLIIRKDFSLPEKKRGRGRPKVLKSRDSDVYPHPEKFSNPTDSDADSELLLTKKVVFINGKKEMGQYTMPKKRRYQSREVNPYKKEYYFKRKESFHSDFKIHKKLKTDYDALYNLKSCYVEIRPNKLVIEALQKYYATKFDDPYMTLRKKFYKVFNERIMRDLKNFQRKLSDIKALLILNENNLEGMEFETNYSKYDLVFPVGSDGRVSDKLIRNSYFVNSVEKGYIMLVDSEILSKHLLGNTYDS